MEIGSKMDVRDASGRLLPPERSVIFTRLRKYRRYFDNSRVLQFKEELMRLRSAMGIPKPCVEQALEIYRQALEKEISGMSTEAAAVAALYMACRMMNMPRPLSEFVRHAKAPRKKVARCYRLLLQELNVKVPAGNPALFVSRIAQQLGLSGEVVKTAIEILQKAKRAGATAGKGPASLAAAAVYMATIIHGYYIPQKHIAKVANITAITLIERYKQLLKIKFQTIRGFETDVEVGGEKHKVKVADGSAEVVEGRGGKKLLRIKIAAEIDGVVREYAFTFGRYGKRNRVLCYVVARADAPGGRETEAARLLALIKALTGREPNMRKKNSKIEILCSRRHLEILRRFAELADVIERWLRK
jgi:transcription initiation factor TFIIIB Brf1 subunit/transcription initiation factor TFIIB